MAEGSPPGQRWFARAVARRVEKKGLRPRLAAALIAILWLIAIVVFGILERLVDPDSFASIGEGMWWATQTVTTVGYGDVVPTDTAGRVMASVLMIGGLSFFAVLTGVITSTFVARAQAESRLAHQDPVFEKLSELDARLTAVGADVARLSAQLEQRPPGER